MLSMVRAWHAVMTCYVVRKDRLSANITCTVTYLNSHYFITLSSKLPRGRALTTLLLERAFGALSIARWTTGEEGWGFENLLPACFIWSHSQLSVYYLVYIAHSLSVRQWCIGTQKHNQCSNSPLVVNFTRVGGSIRNFGWKAFPK